MVSGIFILRTVAIYKRSWLVGTSLTLIAAAQIAILLVCVFHSASDRQESLHIIRQYVGANFSTVYYRPRWMYLVPVLLLRQI